MKTFTFKNGVVHEGFRYDAEAKGVVLRTNDGPKKIPLFLKNPPEIVKGRIIEAFPVLVTIARGTDREMSAYTLAKPNKKNKNSIFLRLDLNLYGSNKRGPSGTFEVVSGNVLPITTYQNDNLIVVFDKTVIRVIPTIADPLVPKTFTIEFDRKTFGDVPVVGSQLIPRKEHTRSRDVDISHISTLPDEFVVTY